MSSVVNKTFSLDEFGQFGQKNKTQFIHDPIVSPTNKLYWMLSVDDTITIINSPILEPKLQITNPRINGIDLYDFPTIMQNYVHLIQTNTDVYVVGFFRYNLTIYNINTHCFVKSLHFTETIKKLEIETDSYLDLFYPSYFCSIKNYGVFLVNLMGDNRLYYSIIIDFTSKPEPIVIYTMKIKCKKRSHLYIKSIVSSTMFIVEHHEPDDTLLVLYNCISGAEIILASKKKVSNIKGELIYSDFSNISVNLDSNQIVMLTPSSTILLISNFLDFDSYEDASYLHVTLDEVVNYRRQVTDNNQYLLLNSENTLCVTTNNNYIICLKLCEDKQEKLNVNYNVCCETEICIWNNKNNYELLFKIASPLKFMCSIYSNDIVRVYTTTENDKDICVFNKHFKMGSICSDCRSNDIIDPVVHIIQI